MVVVIVKFFGSTRQASGIDAVDISIEHGESAESLLKRLVGRFGEELAHALYDSGTAMRKDITLMVNGRNIAALDGLNTKLHDRDLVFIFTSIAGG